jgi:hypothetical protein
VKIACVIALVAAFAVGCGEDAGDAGAGGADHFDDRNGGFAPGAERNAYRDSKDLCAAFPIRQTAREYGGNPADPTSVADAYAAEAYVARFRGAAFQGCLEGLRAR